MENLVHEGVEIRHLRLPYRSHFLQPRLPLSPRAHRKALEMLSAAFLPCATPVKLQH